MPRRWYASRLRVASDATIVAGLCTVLVSLPTAVFYGPRAALRVLAVGVGAVVSGVAAGRWA